MVTPTEFGSLRERIVGELGVIMVIGVADTGKTTLAKSVASDAIAQGKRVAFVDADIGKPVVGPPACIGLRFLDERSDLDDISRPDELRFVGSTEPQGVVLPHVVSTAALVDIARSKADLVIVDTTSVVSGVVGQTMKYHLMELCAPSLVVALQRGAEMEPIIGVLRRFFSARVAKAALPDEIVPATPTERLAARAKAWQAELGPPLQQWRVHPSVFAPTLPESFDLSKLAGMLVGIHDGSGRCLGLGVLEHHDHLLRVATNRGETMHGLRLGSLRVDLEDFSTTRVRLRQLILGI